MAQQNLQMPRFASASGATVSDPWGDGDNFDVEMLAEYLLDDTVLGTNGVSFDFNLDASKQGSTVVSPENSEDGNLPPVAENSVQKLVQPSNQLNNVASNQLNNNVALTMQNAFPFAGLQGVSGVLPMLGATMPSVTSPSPAALPAQQQVLAAPSGENTSKRRRVEATPQVAFPMAGLPNVMLTAMPNGMLNGMQNVMQNGMPNGISNGLQNGMPMLSGQQLMEAAAQALQNQGRGRKKSQAQIDRRRERNRILARRTRLRKKFFFESLQKEVLDLQRENQKLKDIVRTNIDGDDSKKILEECDAAEKLPAGVLEACGENASELDQQDFTLVRSIQQSQHCFIITDPSLQDNPIVFASDDFLKLTGYKREQVLGRNCRFLQGTDTSKEKVETIRKAIAGGEDVAVTLLNYKADGTPFWNKLFVAALRDAQNNIVNYIGVTVCVKSPEPGDPEHGVKLAGEKDVDEDDEDEDEYADADADEP